MMYEAKSYEVKNLRYTLRTARAGDEAQLPALRKRMDGETEFMDRQAGEGYMDETAFATLIENDKNAPNSLFLVAETESGSLVGYARCAGSGLKRLRHQTQFGVCVLKEYWGYAIGKHLLERMVQWADKTGLEKMTLQVLADNTRAAALYKSCGFEKEGILRKDKLLSDGAYHDTILMARFRPA